MDVLTAAESIWRRSSSSIELLNDTSWYFWAASAKRAPKSNRRAWDRRYDRFISLSLEVWMRSDAREKYV